MAKSTGQKILITIGIIALVLLVVGGIVGLLVYLYAPRDDMNNVVSSVAQLGKSALKNIGDAAKKPTKEGADQLKLGRRKRRQTSRDVDQADLISDCWERFFTKTQNLVCLKRANSNGQDNVNPAIPIPNSNFNSKCSFPRMLTEQMLFQTFRQLRCKQIVDDPTDRAFRAAYA